ncbi:hypothetical protein KC19_VG060700 [Ceratodon purpureus]|uniref:Uncharacterized protein n=1 Tax=Ceratodon purpureus TaxID=3225 RepID=A0A8T0HME7_CERPU|nr:hypothetical protein KC19_VG060700 [Ceratodon purpureus]
MELLFLEYSKIGSLIRRSEVLSRASIRSGGLGLLMGRCSNYQLSFFREHGWIFEFRLKIFQGVAMEIGGEESQAIEMEVGGDPSHAIAMEVEGAAAVLGDVSQTVDVQFDHVS